MRIKKIFLIFILSVISVFGGEKYAPRNIKERETLEKARKERYVLGLRTLYFGEDKVGGRSLNDIAKELFEDYLDLDIEIRQGDWPEIYEGFVKGEIDFIPFLTRTPEREKLALFSNKILNETLVVVAKGERLNHLDDLKGKDVYVTKDTVYESFLERINYRNDLDLNIIRVDRIDRDRYANYVDSDMNLIEKTNKLKIGKLPKNAIGVHKKNIDLLEIINNALDEKYIKDMNDSLENRKQSVIKNKFDKVLSEDEKIYIKNLNHLKIGYANVEEISYISNENNYTGVLHIFLNYLLNNLNIVFCEPKNLRGAEWDEKYSEFENGNLDILTLSKTKEREEKFLFTQKLCSLNVYRIDNIEVLYQNKIKVGVLKDTVEEEIAKQHFLESEIERYVDKNRMVAAFKNRRLSSIITLTTEGYDLNRFDINVLEQVPFNLALRKDNVILKNILDKALTEMVNMNEFLDISSLDKKKNDLRERERYHKLVNVTIPFIIIIFVFGVNQTVKNMQQKEETKELLRDELTGLYSRRVYNEFCKSNDTTSGVTILLDLNNFKNANDVYGHDCGDEILIETGRYLNAVFKDDYVFRISGDEFYVFASYEAVVERKIRKLKKMFEESELMKQYGVTFSLGYYFKKRETSMKEAFKYADIAMYEAKRGKKEWYIRGTRDLIEKKRRLDS